MPNSLVLWLCPIAFVDPPNVSRPEVTIRSIHSIDELATWLESPGAVTPDVVVADAEAYPSLDYDPAEAATLLAAAFKSPRQLVSIIKPSLESTLFSQYAFTVEMHAIWNSEPILRVEHAVAYRVARDRAKGRVGKRNEIAQVLKWDAISDRAVQLAAGSDVPRTTGVDAQTVALVDAMMKTKRNAHSVRFSPTAQRALLLLASPDRATSIHELATSILVKEGTVRKALGDIVEGLRLEESGHQAGDPTTIMRCSYLARRYGMWLESFGRRRHDDA